MWFAESAWPTIIVLAVISAVGISVWMQNQRRDLLLGIAVCIVLMPLVWWVEQLIITPRERVEQDILGITRAFQQKEQEQTLGYISARSDLLRATVAGAMNVVNVGSDMHVSDIEVMLTNENSRAVSRVRVNATINSSLTGGGQHYPSRWEAYWQQEGGQWKMVDIVELDVVTGKELHRLPKFSNMQ